MSSMKRLVEDFNYYFDNNAGDVVIFSSTEDGIIGQYTFSASDVLSIMNPTAYNEEFNLWLKKYAEVV